MPFQIIKNMIPLGINLVSLVKPEEAFADVKNKSGARIFEHDTRTTEEELEALGTFILSSLVETKIDDPIIFHETIYVRIII